MSQNLPTKLRIGTRGSALALVQAGLAAEAIKRRFSAFAEKRSLEIISIRASGDHNPLIDKDERLVDVGGKGLFTKELEEALLENRIDLAVHSMKDVPTWMPEGLAIVAVLPREDPRDAFVSQKYNHMRAMPEGAVIGTASMRRQAQILSLRPDLCVVPLRGNVDTRIKKLENGQVDATLLAYAGLRRLGLEAKATAVLETDFILPAVSQGIIGFQIREKDVEIAAMLKQVGCHNTMPVMLAERAMLEVLDGSCLTPIAGYAEYEGDMLTLRGLVAHPEGKGAWRAENTAPVADALALGREVGRSLRRQVPSGILPE